MLCSVICCTLIYSILGFSFFFKYYILLFYCFFLKVAFYMTFFNVYIFYIFKFGIIITNKCYSHLFKSLF